MIYLDNSATTFTLNSAASAAYKYMTESFFNPAAAYSPAVSVERDVNLARARLAAAMGGAPDEVIYTSGGTESNNMAVLGTLKAKRGNGRIIVGATEHPSVYETYMALKNQYEVAIAQVDGEGRTDVGFLASQITANTQLVSIMHVNNETGAINDIPSIYKLLKSANPEAMLHIDGVQGFMKVPFSTKNCDLYSISGHKLHAPKGIGALYVKRGAKFGGGQSGGGQEKNLRSGTLNVPGIMGLDTAVAYIRENDMFIKQMMDCKLRLLKNLEAIPDIIINGPRPDMGAPHILNVSFMGIRGEVLLHALEEKHIYVSTGSACSAHKKGGNRILSAMGITGERQEGAIRFSLCHANTPEQMDKAAQEIFDSVTLLRRFRRR